MANDIKPRQDLIVEPTTDMSELDLQRIDAYVADGLPGLYQISDVDIHRMLDLYLGGKPYLQISRILKIDKTLIMYMSQKYGWYAARRELQHETEATIRNRTMQDKVDNQDFMLKLTHYFKKKLGKRIDSYLATDDEAHADSIDAKDIAQAIKTIESLEKLTADAPVPKVPAPAVGLNVGEGVTMTKNPDGSVDITPKERAVGDILKQFADARRAAEKKDK